METDELSPPGIERPPGDSGPFALGLDEAGRGSVLGPLVVGGFLARSEVLPELRGLGVRDSKVLTPEQRHAVYGRIALVGRRVSIHLSPTVVDRWVRRGQLNELEAIAFGALVRKTRPDVVYADACDPVASRFASRIALHARSEVVIHATHRADTTVPIVGAASIVAKVRRDRAIARLAGRLGCDVGCGYPHDPTTVDLVRRTVSTGATPPWIRQSWATTRRLNPPSTGRALETFAP